MAKQHTVYHSGNNLRGVEECWHCRAYLDCYDVLVFVGDFKDVELFDMGVERN